MANGTQKFQSIPRKKYSNICIGCYEQYYPANGNPSSAPPIERYEPSSILSDWDLSSVTSQLAQRNFPLVKAASGLANHTVKAPDRETIGMLVETHRHGYHVH